MAKRQSRNKVDKRQNGFGSVFQRADGKWVAAVTDPYTGKQMRRYAKTRNQAEALMREMLQRVQGGNPAIDVSITVQEYITTWYDSRAELRRSGNTVYEYNNRLKLHVIPVLGKRPLNKVNRADVERLLDSVAAKGLSKGTVTAVKNALSALFADAVRDRHVAVNPVRGTMLPAMKPKAPKIPPETEEVQQLMDRIDELTDPVAQELGRMVYIGVSTAGRIGEVLAMRWSDLNLDKGSWQVSGTLSKDKEGKPMIKNQTKTGHTRAVKIPPELLDVITIQYQYLVFMQAHSFDWTDNDLVFPNYEGGIRDASNVRRQLKKWFPDWKYGFHDFRHWLASHRYRQGDSEVSISDLMGHESVRTTREVYAHIFDKDKAQIMNSIQDVLKRRV
jgi:integrase